jgi:hypothetical protein
MHLVETCDMGGLDSVGFFCNSLGISEGVKYKQQSCTAAAHPIASPVPPLFQRELTPIYLRPPGIGSTFPLV